MNFVYSIYKSLTLPFEFILVILFYSIYTQENPLFTIIYDIIQKTQKNNFILF